MATKKLYNTTETCVDDSIAGFLKINPGVRLVKGHGVIVRSDIDDFKKSGKVAVLTGGGSGHEPAFMGYVGYGMATGAVHGAIFASPGPAPILAAIRTLASPSGVVLIFNNYTGDRLNFGIAIERARNEGIKVGVVINSEDCAMMSTDRSAGRRGLTGIIMLNKVAGALSEAGKSLEEIVETTKMVANQIGTLGICLTPCSLPGSTGPMFVIGPNDMELGLGLHGEAGVKTVKMMTSRKTVAMMIDHMIDKNNNVHININKGDRIGVLVNNLGSVSDMEMNILVKDTIDYLEHLGMVVERGYNFRCVTTQEMAGFTITILLLDEEITTYLDAECTAPAWIRPIMTKGSKDWTIPPPIEIDQSDDKNNGLFGGAIVDKESESVIYRCVQGVCERLIEAEVELNTLDSGSGDGDCGTTMKSGAQAVLSSLSSGNLAVGQPYNLLLPMAGLAEQNMGGCSGALYSLFLTTGAKSLRDSADITSWVNAMEGGTDAIARYGGAKIGDRTMLDPLCAFNGVLKDKIIEFHTNPLEILSLGVAAAEDMAESTARMAARAGRASYVSPDRLTLPDPGAHAVAIWLRAILNACV